MRSTAAFALALLLAGGCGGPLVGGVPPSSRVSPESLRSRTVIVHVHAPERIALLFDGLAKSSAKRNNGAASQFFATHAGDSFGSGFMVRHGSETFIVTNRHVVDLAEDPEIEFEGAVGRTSAEVIYADALYDLAILAFEEPPKAPPGILELSPAPPKDLDNVIATGFPGLSGAPSYQTTRGQVSNSRLTLADRGTTLTYVQHTAPIDPGSSGGPLTNESGHVVGVNTMKFTGRDNVYLAVPVPAIQRALAAAQAVRRGRETRDWALASLARACTAFLGALNAPDIPVDLPFALANDLVAEKGFESMNLIDSDKKNTKTDQDALRTAFLENPIEVLRASVAVRLWREAHGAEGPPVSCVAPGERPEGDDVRLTIQFQKGKRDTFWRVEQGHWKVSNFSGIQRITPPKPTKPKR